VGDRVQAMEVPPRRSGCRGVPAPGATRMIERIAARPETARGALRFPEAVQACGRGGGGCVTARQQDVESAHPVLFSLRCAQDAVSRLLH